MGTLLKKVGKHAKTYLIKNKLDKKIQAWKKFMHVLNEEYGTHINKTAIENLSQLHRSKPVQLPTANDISKFYAFLCDKRNFYAKLLQKEFSSKAWKELCSYTLTCIQVFNRRRPGESQRMLVSDLKNIRKADYAGDQMLFNSLDIREQEAVKEFSLIFLRGKLNRSVSMLVDHTTLECLNLIMKHREQAGVLKENPYIFGLPGEDQQEFRHLDACTLMRNYSSSCGLSHPETIRATLLRKHIATYCAAMGYTDEQISDVANHLGHEEKIHKNYYRMPVVTKEITRMSKLLNNALIGSGETNKSPSVLSESDTHFDNERASPAVLSESDTYIDNENCSVSSYNYNASEILFDNEVVVEQYSESNFVESSAQLLTGDADTLFENHVVSDSHVECNENKNGASDTGIDHITRNEGQYLETVISQESVSFSNHSLQSNTSDTHEQDTEVNDILKKPFTFTEKYFNEGKELKVVLVPLELKTKETSFLKERSRYKLSSSSESDYDHESDMSEHSEHEVETEKATKGLSKKRIRHTWTTPEKVTVRTVFRNYFKKESMPSLKECQKAVNLYPNLKHRTAQQVRAWIKWNQSQSRISIELEKEELEDNPGKITRKAWTTPEKCIVRKLFGKFIDQLTLPTFKSCQKAVREYPELQNRTDKVLYAYVNNQIKKKQRNVTYGHFSPQKEKLRSPFKTIVLKHFGQYISSLTTPTVVAAMEIMEQHSKLRYMNVESVINTVEHEIRRRKFTHIKRKLVLS
ncbi:uncharacterized protein LOC135143259 [Zophobas morio]|uniref:uncharacterized protein LOC135143259 n=1 Tax=Zophobas morio TaxID=2755281 RepID=UPI003082F250